MLTQILMFALTPTLLVAASTPSQKELDTMLKEIDVRMRCATDFEALVYMEDKRPGSENRIVQVGVYRRDADDALLLFFTKPRQEAGKGYLRIDRNLWFYDPAIGRWDRRTERERIAGTGAHRKDFDDWNLAGEYSAAYLGRAKLGRFEAHKLQLTERPGVNPAYPKMVMWVDIKSGNALKIESRSSTDRLMMTTYYPKWSKLKVPGRKAPMYFPKEVRIVDEIEKGRSTTLVVQKVAARSLPRNQFTKAWIETQSR